MVSVHQKIDAISHWKARADGTKNPLKDSKAAVCGKK